MISDYRGETTVNTDAVRVRAISRQEGAISIRKLWNMFLLPNQTTTATGGNDYDIGSSTYPMRQKGLVEVFVGSTLEKDRYQIVDYNVFKNQFNRDNSTKMVYLWYDVANDVWKMHISPTPESGVTITYSYYWTPPTRTSTTDPVYCIDSEALARAALAEIYEGEDELDKATIQRQLAEQIVDDALGVENMPNTNQLYSFGAIENSTRQNGLGTY